MGMAVKDGEACDHPNRCEQRQRNLTEHQGAEHHGGGRHAQGQRLVTQAPEDEAIVGRRAALGRDRALPRRSREPPLVPCDIALERLTECPAGVARVRGPRPA